MNKTINTTKTSDKLSWGADDILAAHFMFPTEHFRTASQLDDMEEDAFADFCISLLEPLQPLTNDDKKILTFSTFSANRLRIYYQILKIADRQAQVVNETTQLGCEGALLKDEMDHHKFEIIDPSQPKKEEDFDEAASFLSDNEEFYLKA